MVRQAGYMRKQWGEMEEQVSVARDAATQAKASADALINSERAWVMIDIEWTPGYGTRIHGTDQSGDYTHATIRLTCRNEGKTPAWITEKRACVEVVKDLIAEPNFSNVGVVQTNAEALGVEHGAGKPRDIALQGSGWQYGMEQDGTMTVVYGIIKYSDPFASERTTTFGWRILPNNEFETLSLALYPAYNKYT